MTVLHPVPTDTPAPLAPPPVPPVGTIAPPAPGEPNRWSAPDHADQTARDHYLGIVAAFAVLGVITLADLFLIKGTFNRILRDDEALSWILGGSLTLAAVAGAFTAGSYARKAVADPHSSRPDRGIATALILGWVALGAGMFVLRWNAADFAPTAIAYDGAMDSSMTEAAKEQLLAVVLAAVYLATGILAFVDGYKLTNPAAAALRAARARLERLLPRLQQQEALVARLRENLSVAEYEYTRLPQEHAIAIASREALAQELKAHARVQITLHLGDPAATGLVRPANPGKVEPAGLAEQAPPATQEEDHT